jgi:hypothetical protein
MRARALLQFFLWTEWTNTWLTNSAVAIAHLEYRLQTKHLGFYFQLENPVQTESQSKTLLKQPQCKTDNSPTARADMENVRSLSSRPYTPLWRYHTRSPYVPCLSRRAQSGRSSFGRGVWFIQSHIVLVLFLFIYSFNLDIKGVLLSRETTRSFSSKIPVSLHLHSLTHALFLLHCSPTRLLPSVICC